jgi:predicted amidohydrolase YtcJ
MESAISRTTRGGRLLHPEEAVTAPEVLAMYTREAAFALGALEVTGTLEPKKRADLVVLSRDPCHTPTSELRSVRVEQTIIHGETVYEA